MVTSSEKEWAKRVGLKKTSLKHLVKSRGRLCERNVYRDRDGNLYYIDHNAYCGTSREYCYGEDEKEDDAFETYFDGVKSDVAYCLGIEEGSDEWWMLMEI